MQFHSICGLTGNCDRPRSLIYQRKQLLLLGLILIDIIATLGGHLVVYLSNPRGRLMVAAMCDGDGVYTLTFEVGVVNFVSTFKRI